MTDESQTPQQPTEAPEKATSAPPAPRRGVSGSAMMVLVVAVGVLIPLAYFFPEMKSYIRLQPWNPSGPRQAVQQFFTALEAGDKTTLEGLAPKGAAVQVVEEGGKIAAIKVGGSPMQPPSSVVGLKVSGSLDAARLKYSYKAPRSSVEATVPLEGGREAVLMLQRPAGKWVIMSFSSGIPPQPQVTQGPGASKGGPGPKGRSGAPSPGGGGPGQPKAKGPGGPPAPGMGPKGAQPPAAKGGTMSPAGGMRGPSPELKAKGAGPSGPKATPPG